MTGASPPAAAALEPSGAASYDEIDPRPLREGYLRAVEIARSHRLRRLDDRSLAGASRLRPGA